MYFWWLPWNNHSCGFNGCEQNNLIIHIDDAFGDTHSYECFSRTTQNLIVIICKSDLEIDWTFQKTVKEILRHDRKCENQRCKENGLTKLKVVDVEYVGLTPSGVKKVELSTKYYLESIKTFDGLPTCERSHKMVISSFPGKGYKSRFSCDICKEHYSTLRWFCKVCFEDICLKKEAIEDEIVGAKMIGKTWYYSITYMAGKTLIQETIN